MKKLIIVFLFIYTAVDVFAQKKDLSLADIYKSSVFAVKGVPGLVSMADGLHYTALEAGKIVKYEYAKSGNPEVIADQNELQYQGKKILINSYEFNKDETKILIATETESIYRNSTKENYYIYDRSSKSLTPVSDGGKQMHGSFSPDGSQVGFVRDNNIFIKNLQSGKETAVTTDGLRNSIINGYADWVYEEEFTFSQAYFWSPDSKKIAYHRFDESHVKEYDFTEYKNQLYPSEYKYKYPKAGEDASIVSIHVYDVASGKTQTMDIGKETNQYIPRIKWTPDSNILSIVRMNRHQNKLELLFNNATTGAGTLIYTESNDTYIDIHESEGDYIYFTNDKKHFIILSEQSKYAHLYLYDLTGKLVNPITTGNRDVVNLHGIDDKGIVYYTAAEADGTERGVYAVQLDGKNKKKISPEKGFNTPRFSSTMNYFINAFSDANTPDLVAVYNKEGKQIRVLENNAALIKTMQEYNLTKKELFQFKTSQNVTLNGWMMKPSNFDPSKKYPVLLIFYGGPGSNLVYNAFDKKYIFWCQLLTEKQYIVVCVDSRGTTYRGTEFKHCVYKQLGKLETEDEIEAAKYLGALPYVDKSRIGAWGWSYGGFLSSLCITKGADYFKAAIAVAPVTNWRYYDNIFTERYNGLPAENPDGYDSNSPINHVDKLKGKYLLIHGSADDNVHFQNTMEMITALVNADKQFDLFVYPDKNHFIKGGKTQFHIYTKMTDFILNNL
ncbi:MAG TPA: S9 family peptidase [Bacteroidia bacterium]|jgi:dipeptidyl-peptidase-4|nr:S9 family peptidase [Bacteroidia bacterium]